MELKTEWEEVRVACEGAAVVDFKQLKGFQGELKTLSNENYEKLKKEILELGFSEPVSVWRQGKVMHVLNGHQRIRTLNSMDGEGYKIPKIPVTWVEAKNLKEAKKKVLALTSQYGQMTNQGLMEFMKEAGLTLDEVSSSFRFPEINFEGLGELMNPTQLPPGDPEHIPSKVPSRTKLGDVYTLGKHRLVCGDATNITDVEKLMDGAKADFIFTDPPYNVNYEGKTKEKLKIKNDKMSDEQFRNFLRDAFVNMFTVTKGGGAIYVAHADSEGYNFRGAMKDAGWLVKQCIIWVKQSIVMGRQDYHWKHEPILYGWSEGTHKWYGDRKQSTVWEIDRPSKSEEHPTMKPIALIEVALLNSSPKDGLVLDTFGGSGSTLIACEKNGRSCRMLELDPHYCDVIVARWEKYSGQKAVLEQRSEQQKNSEKKEAKGGKSKGQ